MSLLIQINSLNPLLNAVFRYVSFVVHTGKRYILVQRKMTSNVLQTNMEECLSAVECFEEEDSNSRESLSLAEYAYMCVL